jgi:hypothetical protein
MQFAQAPRASSYALDISWLDSTGIDNLARCGHIRLRLADLNISEAGLGQ